MIIKRILAHVLANNEKLTLENRLILNSLIVGIIASFLSSVLSLILSSSTPVLVITTSLFIILSTVYYLVRRNGQFNNFIAPLIIISFILFSIIWIFDGGMNGSNLYPGFVILILALIIVPDRNKKYVISLFIVNIIILYLIQYLKPELITKFSSENIRWADHFITAIYSSIFIFIIVKFLHKNYTIEKQKAEVNEQMLKNINKTKDQFLNIIAHDLLNPISSLMGLSDLLLQFHTKKENEWRERIIIAMANESKQTYNLLNSILDWEKAQTDRINLKPVLQNLQVLVIEVLDIFVNIVENKNIKINSTISKNISVYADNEIIKTVLRNLISNAIKYTQEGGSIKIKATQSKKEIIISVRDTGVGIDQNQMKSLFDITSKESTNGTNGEKGSGLGLILCKELIEKHKGTIWAESEEGVGTTFYFTIPQKFII